MAFDPNKCLIKSIWCGNGNIPNKNIYYKIGTSYECMQKGYGAGMYNEQKKYIGKDSLKNISYIGPVMESNFKKNGINNLTDLKKLKNVKSVDMLLSNILQDNKGRLNLKAYNSVLLYLYDKKIIDSTKLPPCKLIVY